MFATTLRSFAVLILSAVTFSATASAQTTPPPASITYQPGWAMIGGPAGTNFSKLAPLYGWVSSGYYNPGSNISTGCQGYWALVAEQTTITLGQPAGTTQTCSLQLGWNLVADPFTGPALLPTGTMGFAYNPASGGYSQEPAIAPGTSVWVYEGEPATITLQQAASSRTPVTVSISNVPSGPYTVHVGDVVQLFMPGTPNYTATADPSYLHLDEAGLQSTFDCVDQCNSTITQQFWTWHAVSPGTTYINVAPVCSDGTQTCGVVAAVEIDIKP